MKKSRKLYLFLFFPQISSFVLCGYLIFFARSLPPEWKLGIFLLGFLTFFIFQIFFLRFIESRLTRQTQAIRKIAEGKIGFFMDTENELDQELSEKINDLLSMLNGIVGSYKSYVNKLSDFSQDLNSNSIVLARTTQNTASASEEITASMEEVDASMNLIADMIQNQHKTLAELIHSVKNMTNHLDSISGQMSNIRANSEYISQLAETGNRQLSTVRSTMEQVAVSSQEMKKITDVIRGISERINLLSLNAAIEAARAGEEGKGFAVVAQEVSKLAEQTARSIKGISSHIEKSSQDFQVGIRETLSSTEKFTEILANIRGMSKDIESIDLRMQDESKNSAEISRLADSAQRISDEVKLGTRELKTSFGEISKSTVEISTTNQDQASIAADTEEIARELRVMSGNIQNLLEFFQEEEGDV
jgi:methyl-accepting chemotaxis protein